MHHSSMSWFRNPKDRSLRARGGGRRDKVTYISTLADRVTSRTSPKDFGPLSGIDVDQRGLSLPLCARGCFRDLLVRLLTVVGVSEGVRGFLCALVARDSKRTLSPRRACVGWAEAKATCILCVGPSPPKIPASNACSALCE